MILGLFFSPASGPLIMHLAFLPGGDHSLQAPSLEKRKSSSLTCSLWMMPESGIWRLEAAAPTGFDLYPDGRLVTHAPGFIPDNGGGGEYGRVYYLQQDQARAAAIRDGILPTPVPDGLCAPFGGRMGQ